MGMTEISRLLWFLRIDEDSTVRHYAAKTVSNVLGRHCETRVKYVVFDRTRTLNQNPQSIITVSLTKFERQYFNHSNISLYHSRNSREYFNHLIPQILSLYHSLLSSKYLNSRFALETQVHEQRSAGDCEQTRDI